MTYGEKYLKNMETIYQINKFKKKLEKEFRNKKSINNIKKYTEALLYLNMLLETYIRLYDNNK